MYNEKISITNLGEVQETLVIPLLGRAMISKRPTGTFYDGKAIEIIKQIDYDFKKMRLGLPTLEATVLRTMIFDTWVEDFLMRYPKATVIEIGCGLNTRFERVDNGQVTWFDLDLPDVYEVWKLFFEENDRRSFIASSVFDTSWIDHVLANSNPPYMFVSEASLIYFSAEEVKQLFTEVASKFEKARWAFDSVGSGLIGMQDRHYIMRLFKARLKWAVDSTADIESWDSRIRVIKRDQVASPSADLRSMYPWWVRLAAPVVQRLLPKVINSYHANLAQFR